MKRYEHILNGGKEELAVAIGFCLAIYHEVATNTPMSCDELKAFVDLASKDIEPWLDEEIDE